MLWARLMRGTSSRLKAVTRLAGQGFDHLGVAGWLQEADGNGLGVHPGDLLEAGGVQLQDGIGRAEERARVRHQGRPGLLVGLIGEKGLGSGPRPGH